MLMKCCLFCCAVYILLVEATCNWNRHYDGSIYYFSSDDDDRRGFGGAQSACAEKNATLASINSEAENTYLVGRQENKSFWIGLVCRHKVLIAWLKT